MAAMPQRGVGRVGRAYLISLGVWAVLSLLTGWQYRIFDLDRNIPSTLWDMIALAETRGLTFALLTPPIFWFVGRYGAGSKKPLPYVIYAIGAVPFLLVYASLRWLVLPWKAELAKYVPHLENGPLELIRGGFADQITMYIAIVAAAHAWVYFERARRQEIERYEFQQALVASELQALKMQLHPHFLFNTLNGISTLVDSDPARSKEMIVKLSTLLRTALQHSGSDLVSLEQELAFITEYLDLERMRLGARLSVTWSIAPDTVGALVPQLVLQPIVENAIRHGVGSSRDRGWVEISSSRSGSAVELRVRNSVGRVRPRGSGVGLRNTAARLRHLYGDEAKLSFALAADQSATTTVLLPALGLDQAGSGELPLEAAAQ